MNDNEQEALVAQMKILSEMDESQLLEALGQSAKKHGIDNEFLDYLDKGYTFDECRIIVGINALCRVAHENASEAGWWNEKAELQPHEGVEDREDDLPIWVQQKLTALRNSILEERTKVLDRNFGEMISLMHSELSECLEAERKDLMDDHLPEYPGQVCEFGDTFIRIGDTCGKRKYALGEVVVLKMRYNKQRLDHKRSERAKAGGKKF